MAGKPRILIAPLDWGLGHTTRCIPVIHQLLQQGAAVVAAGNEKQRHLLLQEFPGMEWLPLDGYNVQYTKNGKALPFKMLLQAPRLLQVIKSENIWLKKIVAANAIDGIISDNRFGLYHDAVPSIFITHQLCIKTGNKLSQAFLQKINYKNINRFTQCWIPDFKGESNLAGALSHPHKMPGIPAIYIGPLSRMQRNQTKTIKGHLLFIASGPEPQRTLFEELVLQQIKNYTGTATLVRGLPGKVHVEQYNNIEVYNHLPKQALQQHMQKAEYIICRSGYSSVMDVYATVNKAVFVPTPGQTEQEYLGRYLMQKKFAPMFTQNKFNLNQMLAAAANFAYADFYADNENHLQKTIADFIGRCRMK